MMDEKTLEYMAKRVDEARQINSKIGSLLATRNQIVNLQPYMVAVCLQSSSHTWYKPDGPIIDGHTLRDLLVENLDCQVNRLRDLLAQL